MNFNENIVLNFILKLVDPFLLIDPRFRTRVQQKTFASIKIAFFFHVTVWPVIYVAHYFFNDHLKQPQSLYFQYRFGMAAFIGFMGIVGFFYRQNELLLKTELLIISALMCYVQSWSMTLGYEISGLYLVILPLIILASFSRSFVLSTLWLCFLIYSSKHFWLNHAEIKHVFSNSLISIAVLLGIIITRWVWINSLAIQFESDDLRIDTFRNQEIFNKQIRSFISPVLVQELETSLKNGATIVGALDSILRLRRSTVCVLFSDLRNFSTRSDDVSFIEDELIPSAKSIIDGSERNSGVAKQTADAVLVYYNLPDAEESLLRGIKDGFRCCIEEKNRTKKLDRKESERFFTITFGDAYVGNMASSSHRETTIIGSPANLAARIDALTKNEIIKKNINLDAGILLADSAASTLRTFSTDWSLQLLDLAKLDLSIRSFPNEKRIYFLHANDTNLEILNKLLEMNGMKPLSAKFS